MKRRAREILLAGLLLALPAIRAFEYPVDGYELTGIRRLERLRLRLAGELAGPVPVAGGRKPLAAITLHLRATADSTLSRFPEPDPGLQRELERLFADRNQSYSVALLDITPGRPMRFASLRADLHYNPGSVGKLAIAVGLFRELERLFPDSEEARRALLRERMITASDWIDYDHHKVVFFDPATRRVEFRRILPGDVFSLYEWADHMLSASANAAASTVWKECMLMRAFGGAYPPTAEEEERYFAETPREELRATALSIVNDPLREIGIGEGEWQLGSFFTRTGKRKVPGAASYASPNALLTFLVRLEQGRVVDAWSSLEIKRLLYMTEKRIRYASSPALRDAAVYFKSGSLYKCRKEPGFACGKYMGNVVNTMNSVAIVEAADGRVYLVALMSNVLRINSAVEHQTLATYIERILKR